MQFFFPLSIAVSLTTKSVHHCSSFCPIYLCFPSKFNIKAPLMCVYVCVCVCLHFQVIFAYCFFSRISIYWSLRINQNTFFKKLSQSTLNDHIITIATPHICFIVTALKTALELLNTVIVYIVYQFVLCFPNQFYV